MLQYSLRIFIYLFIVLTTHANNQNLLKTHYKYKIRMHALGVAKDVR
jgi:hypothetical protein